MEGKEDKDNLKCRQVTEIFKLDLVAWMTHCDEFDLISPDVDTL